MPADLTLEGIIRISIKLINMDWSIGYVASLKRNSTESQNSDVSKFD